MPLDSQKLFHFGPYIDAENVAEELVRLFARVGILREILTDQGSNLHAEEMA